MDDLNRLGVALCDATRAAEDRGSLANALPALTPMAFVALMFAGRELLLLALDQEMENAQV